MPPDAPNADEERPPAQQRLRRFRQLASRLVAAHTVDEVARVTMTDGVAAAGAAGGSLMIVQGKRLQLISERNIANGSK